MNVDRITANANRSLGFIKRNIKTKSPQIRETAYQSLVRPQLEYASAVWDPHTKDKAHKVEGTVSGSGTGPLDYGATGQVPDTEPRL